MTEQIIVELPELVKMIGQVIVGCHFQRYEVRENVGSRETSCVIMLTAQALEGFTRGRASSYHLEILIIYSCMDGR
jgi:hypothetical protein